MVRLRTPALPIFRSPRLLQPPREAALLVERLGWGSVPVEVLDCVVPGQPRLGTLRHRAPLAVHGEDVGEVLITEVELAPRLIAVFHGVALDPLMLESESLRGVYGGVVIVLRDALERDASLTKLVKNERYQLLVSKATALAKRLDTEARAGAPSLTCSALDLERGRRMDEQLGAGPLLVYILAGAMVLGALGLVVVELVTMGALAAWVGSGIFTLAMAATVAAVRADNRKRQRKALLGVEPEKVELRAFGPPPDQGL